MPMQTTPLPPLPLPYLPGAEGNARTRACNTLYCTLPLPYPASQPSTCPPPVPVHKPESPFLILMHNEPCPLSSAPPFPLSAIPPPLPRLIPASPLPYPATPSHLHHPASTLAPTLSAFHLLTNDPLPPASSNPCLSLLPPLPPRSWMPTSSAPLPS